MNLQKIGKLEIDDYFIFKITFLQITILLIQYLNISATTTPTS